MRSRVPPGLENLRGGARIVLRHLWSRPARTLLTGLNLAVCTIAVLGAATVLDTLDRAASAPASASTLVVQSANGFGRLLPNSHLDAARRLEVESAHGIRVYYGSAHDPRKVFVVLFVTEGGASTLIDSMASRTTPEALQALARDPGSVLVGRLTAEANGWSVGDTVSLDLRSSVPDPVTVRVAGLITDGVLARDVVGHYEFTRRVGMHPDFNFLMVRPRPGAIAETSRRIDETFRNSRVPTRTETGSAMARRFEDANSMRPLVVGATTCVVLACMMITGASLALALRERAGEVPVFKALGFGHRWILALLLAEPLALAVASAMLGVAVFLALSRGGLAIDLNIASVFHPTVGGVCLAFGVSVSLAMASVASALRTALGTPVAESLQRHAR